jgi:hypothetical protein
MAAAKFPKAAEESEGDFVISKPTFPPSHPAIRSERSIPS